MYSCSVWDTTSAREIVSINPPLIKVGSPSNQHFEMQKVLRDECGPARVPRRASVVDA